MRLTSKIEHITNFQLVRQIDIYIYISMHNLHTPSVNPAMNRMILVVRCIPHPLRHHGSSIVLGTTTTFRHGRRQWTSLLTLRSRTTTIASSSSSLRITSPPPSLRNVAPTATATATVAVAVAVAATVATAVVVAIVTTSLSIRQWREEQIRVQLPLYQPPTHINPRQSGTEALTTTIQRAGLMKSRPPSRNNIPNDTEHNEEEDVSRQVEELQSIRQWHLQHGYHGAIVVRDITQTSTTTTAPSYSNHNNNNNLLDPTTHNHESRSGNISVTVQPVRYQWQQYIQRQNLARRECYYIYYEICPVTGRTTQQIYIRGTTVWIDIVTCLLTYMMYDTELQCHVHYGFRQHAHRILQDILPLLSPTARIELCGHSLGGAVASILAMILQVRGYQVTKLTTIGEPAYLWFPSDYHDYFDHHFFGTKWQSKPGSNMNNTTNTTASKMSHSGSIRDHVRSLLPPDQLRIENDCDIVPYLPPFGSHVGNKIWITRTGGSSSKNDSRPFDSASTTKVCWVDASLTTTPTYEQHDPPPTQSSHNKTHSTNWWWWTESIWINLCVPELCMRYRVSHRLSNYIRHLRWEDDDDDGTTKSE